MKANKSYRVIDSHAHMGPVWNFYLPFNDDVGMLENMNKLGIEATVFSSNMAISSDIKVGNRYTLDACLRNPGRFLGQFFFNPNFPDLMKEEIPEYFSHDCIVGFKIHPELSGDYPMNGKNYEIGRAHV